MADTEEIKVSLTDSVLEARQLDKVFSFLQEATAKPVIITDYKGRICGTREAATVEVLDDNYLSLPEWKDNGRFFYNEDTQTLYYCVGYGEEDGFIIIKNVDSEHYATYLTSLDQASLAVRTYLAQLSVRENLENRYTNNFITDILLRNINIKDLMKHNYALIELDLQSLYYVCILEPERNLNDRELQALRSYTKEWLTFTDLDIFCTVWEQKYVVFLCPTHYDKKTLEVDYSWDRHLVNITRYHKDVGRKFHFNSMMGIGNKYALNDLHHSYQEALFTIHLSKLTGKSNLVRHFSDLGIFTLICNNDLSDLKSFSDKYLEPVLQFDSEYKRELLDSLLCFFDANLDIKDAADKLHMHINTLRYRLKKVEELTGMDLQKMDDRANLYAALKIYKLLLATTELK